MSVIGRYFCNNEERERNRMRLLIKEAQTTLTTSDPTWHPGQCFTYDVKQCLSEVGGWGLTRLWEHSHIWGANNCWCEFGDVSVSVFNINFIFLAEFELELQLDVMKQIKRIVYLYNRIREGFSNSILF